MEGKFTLDLEKKKKGTEVIIYFIFLQSSKIAVDYNSSFSPQREKSIQSK